VGVQAPKMQKNQKHTLTSDIEREQERAGKKKQRGLSGLLRS